MIKSYVWDIIGAVIFLMIAAVIAVAGFFMVRSIYVLENNENVVTVPAVITEVKEYRVHYSSETRKEKTAYVEYEYDGVKYKSGLNVYAWWMSEGRELEVKLDPASPADPRIDDEKTGIAVMVVMGVIFFSVGVYHIRQAVKKKRCESGGDV